MYSLSTHSFESNCRCGSGSDDLILTILCTHARQGWFVASSYTGVGDAHAVIGMAHHQHDRGADGGAGNYSHAAHDDIVQSIPVPADRIGCVRD